MHDDTGQWLTTLEASGILGVSERAIQKRCKAGKLDARRVTTERGLQWEINPASVQTNKPDAEQTNQRANANEPRAPNKRTANEQAPRSQGANERTDEPRTNELSRTGANEPTNHKDQRDMEAELRAQLERERGEVAFLRNVVEAQQRDAVELRQALKRALDLAPKQLTTGTPQSAPEPESAPQNATANNVPEATPGAGKSPATRRGEGLQMLRTGLKRMFGK